MYCKQARQQLQQNDGKQDQHYCDELFDHLTACQDCWRIANVLWQHETADDTAAIDISTIDGDAVLDRAWNAHARRKADTSYGMFAHLAAAAMVVVAVSTLVLQFWNNGPSPQSGFEPAAIVINSAGVRYVDFMLTSAQTHREATITLALDENLALSGYPGMKEISWGTSLQAGDNQLTLPLQLQNDEHGVITVNVTSGGRNKQMMFTVQPPEREQNTRVI